MGKGTVESLQLMLEKGNTKAFTDFYTQYFKRLIIESDKYVKDIYVAEEIVQDVFLKIWERSADFTQIQSIKSYLYRSVINSSINYINRQRNLEQHHQKIADEFTEDQADQLDEENELIVCLFDEIEKLPPKCKEIFKMNRFERLKYREIAMKLDVSERTVENHIANALKLLREAMLKKRNIEINNSIKLFQILFFF
ncbi:RNA polymerase sigma-70 factor [Pedobacter sp.]|uniref:RNA polymerase sigma-70 factor n=1 Tax=Pedobacter sp. TaxID=1411316 RepID=UPI0031D7992D